MGMTCTCEQDPCVCPSLLVEPRVGDRVRFKHEGKTHEGVVVAAPTRRFVDVMCGETEYCVSVFKLTIVSADSSSANGSLLKNHLAGCLAPHSECSCDVGPEASLLAQGYAHALKDLRVVVLTARRGMAALGTSGSGNERAARLAEEIDKKLAEWSSNPRAIDESISRGSSPIDRITEELMLVLMQEFMSGSGGVKQ